MHILLAQAQPTTVNLVDYILPLIPWVFVIAVVWFFGIRVVRRQFRLINQAQEQRRAIQEKLDRIITLLEERNRSV